jgi:hypothetical protein
MARFANEVFAQMPCEAEPEGSCCSVGPYLRVMDKTYVFFEMCWMIDIFAGFMDT